MKRKLIRFLKSLTSTKLLAVLFVLFGMYVSIGTFPKFLHNTYIALKQKVTLTEYIDIVNDQYYDMFSTASNQPYFLNKGTYINFNGLMANALNQPEMNETIKLKNGHLVRPAVETEKSVLDKAFQNLQKVNDQQKRRGKHFLFVLAPSQMYQKEILLPKGYKNTSDEEADYLINLLDMNNVPYLDLRQCMSAEEINNDEAFFITDHHWKPETGLWAYGKIIEKLAENESISPVNEFYISPENFDFNLYQKAFLGSSGKRTGIYYAGIDDFCLIAPKYSTDISIEDPIRDVRIQGEFKEVAYTSNAVARCQNPDYFNDNPYGFYGWSDRAWTRWRNENAPEDKKIMMIGDSFGNVPFSFMSLYFTACDELDMRHFKDDFAALYESYDPDCIIILSCSTSGENVMYPYFVDATENS